MNATIDLDQYRTPADSRVFIGAELGKIVREKSQIDKLADNNEVVTIIIPEDIGAITPSFLEEFFLNVALKLDSQEAFFKKFHFIDNGLYKIQIHASRAVRRILFEKNAPINRHNQ